jgi:hypothetical protein
MSHSIHDRLLSRARQTGRPFQELLTYFAMERFIYRLSISPYADHFVLKGVPDRTWPASGPWRQANT